jgi:hypothetical protein
MWGVVSVKLFRTALDHTQKSRTEINTANTV